MSASTPHPPAGEDRHADLAELLAHLTRCWDDERRALARTMHDSVGSSLTALTMHLSLLDQKLPQEPALKDRVRQMKQLLAQVVDTNRAIQHDLWNDKLEFLGIKVALAELVADFGKAHGIAASASLPEGDVHNTREQGVALLRCAEEGLRNVAAHAKAGQVELILDDNEDELMLSVRDDGGGSASYETQAAGCHGLRLLRERVRHLGGSLSIGNAGPRGAILCVKLPHQPASTPTEGSGPGSSKGT